MRDRWFRRAAAVLGLWSACVVSACTDYVSAYEEAVYDFEPIYCYRTLGGIDCQATPSFRDERRLVNYFGPAPVRYPAPVAPPIRLDPPPPVDWFSRDPDPVLGRPAFLVTPDPSPDPAPETPPEAAPDPGPDLTAPSRDGKEREWEGYQAGTKPYRSLNKHRVAAVGIHEMLAKRLTISK